MPEQIYVCIDLKSFYASVECRERGLDPMTTNLVVADASRTEKTICLAVSPSLKAYGIPGRPRLFEVVQKVKGINAERRAKAPGRTLTGSSSDVVELAKKPEYALDYVTAPPRMAFYMDYSTRIYRIYLRYIAPEDIHVYSIDEVMIDLTEYTKFYHQTAEELTRKMIHEVFAETGITATAGLGTNLYLAKIAMDIVAKHAEPDESGVRLAYLDEMSYRRQLWAHRPLTDFWRVGRGYARKLEQVGLLTMGDVARCSIGKPGEYYNEDLLYKLFGINAELLIDHAWGYEPCTMKEIKAYRPESNGLSSGQVLMSPYPCEKTRLIVKEMTELLVLDLVQKGLVTDQLVLTIGYDAENLSDPEISRSYHGEITTDFYGRQVPKHAHGTVNFPHPTSSTREIREAADGLFTRIVNPKLLARRLNVTVNHLVNASSIRPKEEFVQLDLFTDYAAEEKQREEKRAAQEREEKMQQAMLTIQKRFGKNAILKGMNLEEGATTVERNGQIGGHKK